MKTHRIQGTDNLLMMTIKDQASGLEHGWREAIQNGLDSPGSSRVDLVFDHEHTVVRDDGEGVDISSEDGLALLKNLGASSKDRDDDTTIGQFGIGKGQIIAKGRTAFISQGTALVFDVEGWGLECKEVPAGEVGSLVEAADGEHDGSGITVVVEHYANEVPSEGSYRWGRYEDDVVRRFKYAGVTGKEVAVNGEVVTNGAPSADGSYTHEETFESDATGPVHIAVKHGQGSVAVYSRGVYVRETDGSGVTGDIVTERNLDLNFARNEIKSGCGVWRAARDRLAEVRLDLFESVPSERLNADARAYVARRAMDNDEVLARFRDKKVLRTASETYVSVADVESRGNIGYAEATDKAADRLGEAYGMMVLDTRDSAVKAFQGRSDDTDVKSPDVFDVAAKADELGLMKKSHKVSEMVLNRRQSNKLQAARELARRMGINRQIVWGESAYAKAWTDGRSYIAITDEAAPSPNRAAWIPELYRELVHEWTHDEATSDGCASHGINFNRTYRQRIDRFWTVLSEFMLDVERNGLADTVEGVEVVRPDMPSWDDIRGGRR